LLITLKKKWMPPTIPILQMPCISKPPFTCE
jgi:hypothetical protein